MNVDSSSTQGDNMASIEDLKNGQPEPKYTPKTIKNTSQRKTVRAKNIAVGEITPVELRDWDGENLYIRNNTDNLLSFDDGKGNILRLGGKNTGEHISVLEIVIARNPGIQRRWRNGDVSVSTDPSMEDELYLAEQLQTQILEEDTAKKTAYTVVPNDANVVYKATIPTFEPKW